MYECVYVESRQQYLIIHTAGMTTHLKSKILSTSESIKSLRFFLIPQCAYYTGLRVRVFFKTKEFKVKIKILNQIRCNSAHFLTDHLSPIKSLGIFTINSQQKDFNYAHC